MTLNSSGRSTEIEYQSMEMSDENETAMESFKCRWTVFSRSLECNGSRRAHTEIVHTQTGCESINHAYCAYHFHICSVRQRRYGIYLLENRIQSVGLRIVFCGNIYVQYLRCLAFGIDKRVT